MAQAKQTSRRSGDGTASEAIPPGSGDRVILKRERVLVLPDGLDDEVLKDVQTALRKGTRPDPRTAAVVTAAWIEVARHTARDKRRAIEAHAGKPNTPDAKPGIYRAPTLSSWKGGVEYVKPDAPKVEAHALDD